MEVLTDTSHEIGIKEKNFASRRDSNRVPGLLTDVSVTASKRGKSVRGRAHVVKW